MHRRPGPGVMEGRKGRKGDATRPRKQSEKGQKKKQLAGATDVGSKRPRHRHQRQRQSRCRGGTRSTCNLGAILGRLLLCPHTRPGTATTPTNSSLGTDGAGQSESTDYYYDVIAPCSALSTLNDTRTQTSIKVWNTPTLQPARRTSKPWDRTWRQTPAISSWA